MGINLYRRRKRNQELVRGAIVCAAVLLAFASYLAAWDIFSMSAIGSKIERLGAWIALLFWLSSAFWVAGLPDREADGTLDTASWFGRVFLSILLLGIAMVVIVAAVLTVFWILDAPGLIPK